MKKKNVIILFILGFLLITKNVDAAANTSLCAYGTAIKNSSYCRINGISIVSSTLDVKYRHLIFKKDTDASQATELNRYSANILNRNQIIFCLDPNLSPPGNTIYKYSRPLNTKETSSSDHDVALTKLYQLYVEEYYNSLKAGRPTNEAENINYQIALITMRAISYKYGQNLKSVQGAFADINTAKDQAYKSLVNQFDGSNTGVTNKLLAIGDTSNNKKILDKAQNWYCQALLTCKNCNKKLAGLSHCKKLLGKEKTSITTFDIKITSDDQNSVTTSTGNSFTKTVPFTVTGLNKLKNTVPNSSQSFAIKGVKCNNKNLSCTLDGSKYSNILSNLGKDEDSYTFNVVISGNRSDILNKKSVNVEIEYEKQHIMDPDNLSIIQSSIGSILSQQRMMIYMPSTPQKTSITKNILLPTSCEYEVVNGKPKYLFDGREVTEIEYLNRGCCNVDVEKLKEEQAVEIYLNRCSAEDVVYLEEQCINDDNDEDDGKFTESYVYQKNLEYHIMPNIKEAEKKYNESPSSYTYDDYKNVLNNFSNNVEHEYTSTGLSSGNDYCKMYTSERVDILLPGTVEAASGRYFVFKPGHQPLIKGTIYADFHTDVDRWYKDLTALYDSEKATYNSWQYAISYAEEKQNDYENENKKLEKAKEEKVSKEEYDEILNNVKNAQIAAEDAQNAIAPAKNRYQAAKASRVNISKYIIECGAKTNIKKDWKYNLNPNVTFYYKQKVNQIDENSRLTGKAEIIVDEVEMEPSYEKDGKYWPEVSTKPELIDNSIKGTSSIVTKSFEGYGGLPGGFSITYDQTSDYQIGYQQKLYYKPTKKYYSLLPSGQYVTSIEEREDVNLLDVGYVFNTQVTNYEGYYETWFEINNVGHIQGEESPNVQKSINKYLTEHSDEFLNHEEKKINDVYSNMCFYYNKEILYTRGCHLDCESPGADTELRSQIYYRTISIYNVNPNNRENTNWTTEKGLAAKKAIEEANDEIYDDYSKKYLEYSFTLTTKDMAEIKTYNKENKYDDFKLTCVNGMECESSFIDKYADSGILAETRKEKWKYFKNGVYEKGSIQSVLGGEYPSISEELTDWP